MKSDNAYLRDILDALDAIQAFVRDRSKEDFLSSDLLQSAVIRKLEIIGEATKKLSKEFRGKYKHVAWKSAAGMRDLLIHHYLGVDAGRVWDTVKESLPSFRQQIHDILGEIEKGQSSS
ncbi:MAG: DUF86 domain-containing protein [Chloroflexi bacterium]|nr:DUF86 domain-containing protein [Chloroflexota bacterium]